MGASWLRGCSQADSQDFHDNCARRWQAFTHPTTPEEGPTENAFPLKSKEVQAAVDHDGPVLPIIESLLTHSIITLFPVAAAKDKAKLHWVICSAGRVISRPLPYLKSLHDSRALRRVRRIRGRPLPPQPWPSFPSPFWKKVAAAKDHEGVSQKQFFSPQQPRGWISVNDLSAPAIPFDTLWFCWGLVLFGVVPPPPGVFTDKQWRQVQALTNKCWNCWSQEHLPASGCHKNRYLWSWFDTDTKKKTQILVLSELNVQLSYQRVVLIPGGTDGAAYVCELHRAVSAEEENLQVTFENIFAFKTGRDVAILDSNNLTCKMCLRSFQTKGGSASNLAKHLKGSWQQVLKKKIIILCKKM